MYAWLWRHLPGPFAARLGVAAVLLVGVVALLFFVVFPVVDPLLPFNHVTVNSPSAPPTPGAAPVVPVPSAGSASP
ncbi:MAG: hypothetical protein ACYDAQ_18580 [Mycobacteriales bacterium]